jgi:2-(1,2-epoxy-1,2-dihydrophenyl)acetyl-CoA isomerase
MAEPLVSAMSDGVLTLTLNDPETLNALTPVMTRLLQEQLSNAAGDPDVKVVVLTGAGRAFSSGGNVKAFGTADPLDPLAVRWADTPYWNATEMRVDRLIKSADTSILLHTMPKPTVAMIRGPVAGAALSLAAACDFRIVSETALFTTAFGRIGTSGDFGGSYFLTYLLGPAKTKELYFLSDKLDAAKAHAIGLVDRVVPPVMIMSFLRSTR